MALKDPKVTTYASNLWAVNLDRLTTTSEYEENVLICVSPQTRELILSLLNFYAYWPGRWRLDDASFLGSVDRNTIIETVDMAVQEVMLIVGCETDLTRIAEVLEQWYDRSYVSFFDFKALLEASGLEGIVFWLEALEEVGDLLGILPDVDITMPTDKLIDMIMTVMYRRRLFNKMDNVNASLQGLIVSESGPAAPVILDAIQTLIPGQTVVDNILGDLDEAISSIPATLITAILGNYMTNRTKDIADAVNNLEASIDLTGVEDALTQIAQTCEFCGSSGGCECTGYGTVPPPVENQGNPVDDPPPAGFSTWDDYFLYKCAASNRIVDDYIATLRAVAGLASSIPNIVPQQEFALIIGTALSQWATFGLMRLGYQTGHSSGLIMNALLTLFFADHAYYNRIEELADALEADKEAIICDLFGAVTGAEVYIALESWQNSHYASLSYAPPQTQAQFTAHMNNVRAWLISRVVRNVIFQYHVETDAYNGEVDCDTCGDGCLAFQAWPTFDGGGGVATEPTAGTFQIVATNDTLDGNYRAGIAWDYNFDTFADCDEFGNPEAFAAVSVTSGTVTPISGAFPTWRLWQEDKTLIYSHNSTPFPTGVELGSPPGVGRLLVVSSTAFTIEIETDL